MATDKKIAILMAVYEPNMGWLKEQLNSLNAQTYPNLQLYIRDDCSPTVPYENIKACVAECITNIPYTITRNEKNMGSNLTFQNLTEEAEGDYFAYCDQDDVWLPEKLEVLEQTLTNSDALLVCSDMTIIDGQGKQTAGSITEVRKHHVFKSGEGLAEGLLFRNFVTGCTMMMRAEQAKSAIPFCPYMVHDHYLALWCAARGSILSLPQKLIRYRIHGENQTEVLAGVHDKESYRKRRIEEVLNKFLWLEKHPEVVNKDSEPLHEGFAWARARYEYFNGNGGAATVWKYRGFGPMTSLFELVGRYLPDYLFMIVVKLRRKNIL